MSWLRIDDGFAEHPKVMDLTDRAFRLHVSALCFCVRNLTDGFLTEKSLRVVCALALAQRKHVVELRDAGLWVVDGDGYRIQDFLDYNPSAEKVKQDREAARERMRRIRSPERAAELPAKFGDPVPSPRKASVTRAVTPMPPNGPSIHLVKEMPS